MADRLKRSVHTHVNVKHARCLPLWIVTHTVWGALHPPFPCPALCSDDEKTRQEACRTWCVWEDRNCALASDFHRVAEEFTWCPEADAIARIEAHYFVNNSFLEADDQVLRDMPKIAHLPGIIVQGRYDLEAPPAWAYDVSLAWPAAQLRLVDGAGHSAYEVPICAALVAATEETAARLSRV